LREEKFPKRTKGTLEASPWCIAFRLDQPLLFLRCLLGGLLRGWFLGCFLGCHFAYSPFSMGCIDSCKKKLQLKNV
jgi:hypothetical protein